MKKTPFALTELGIEGAVWSVIGRESGPSGFDGALLGLALEFWRDEGRSTGVVQSICIRGVHVLETKTPAAALRVRK